MIKGGENMELRNPFGLRDNKIVLIEDMTKNEKGLRCNCVCPSCKEPFEARMGEIRRHHFAHSGQGCDEVNAYMTGLYMLLNEYLTEGRSLHLPPVIVGFRLSSHSYITQESIEEDTWLLSESTDKSREIKVFGKTDMKFQACYIDTSSNGKPNAIIATANGRNLAIRITPPDTICKTKRTRKYKDYSTIEVDLADAGEMIQQSRKMDFFRYLSEHDGVFRWIYNQKIETVYPKIIERSKAYYNAAQERMRKEEAERKELVNAYIKFTRGEMNDYCVEASNLTNRLDVKYCINDRGRLKPVWIANGYSVTTLGEELKLQLERAVEVEEDEKYQLLKVTYEGEICEGELKEGEDSSYNKLFQVQEWDILISNMGVGRGAVGIVPPYHSGKFVSSEYTILRGKSQEATVFYTNLLRTKEILADILSSTTGMNRGRIKWDVIKDINVPLCDTADKNLIALTKEMVTYWKATKKYMLNNKKHAQKLVDVYNVDGQDSGERWLGFKPPE